MAVTMFKAKALRGSDVSDGYTLQSQEITYYPNEGILRWKSTAGENKSLNWDKFYSEFPSLEEYYDFENQTFHGVKKPWDSSERSIGDVQNEFINKLAKCDSHKTKVYAQKARDEMKKGA